MSVAIVPNTVGGQPVEPVAELAEVMDPATGQPIARVPLSGAAEVDAAVAAAAEAFPAWSEEPVTRRARRMFALHQLLEERADELARIVSLENGKHIDEAAGEVRRGIEVVELAASSTTLLKGETLSQVAGGVDVAMHRFPLGVVGAITPFNFPAMIPMWFAPLALVAGNTFVLKPSPRTPMAAARIAELFADAGFPPGTFNVVHGGAEAAEALIEHPDVEAISFVGSSPVAREVYRRAAATGKRVQALGGAKNHIVVMPDADLDATAKAVFASAFSNAGQRCLAGSVLVPVGEQTAEAIVERLAALAAEAPVAPGYEPQGGADIQLTPVTTEQARERITGYIERAVEAGGRLVTDGRRGEQEGGYFLGPTIVDGVDPEMELACEEVFGPVLAVLRVDDLEQAVATINASRYGNATAIFTRSGGSAREFMRAVGCGMIGVNIGVAAPVAYFPFSGWADSFFGDLHANGTDGIDFYTDKKVVTSRWPS